MFKLPKAKVGNKWTEWKGGKCPVSEGTKVDVIYRGGRRGSFIRTPLNNNLCVWVHMGWADDIVAYRLSWIRHRGGKHPGEPGDEFVVRFREGTVWRMLIKDHNNDIAWRHLNHPLDIMAYKPVL